MRYLIGRFTERVCGLLAGALIVVGTYETMKCAMAEAKHTSPAAAQLEHLRTFITWPEATPHEPPSDFIIAVFGSGTETGFVLPMSNAAGSGSRVQVKTIASLADYQTCHILFVPAATPPEVCAALIRQTRNSPVLLVGESERFCRWGAPLSLVPTATGDRAIEVNLDAMRVRQLRANAKLLKVAKVIRGQEE